MRPKFLNNTNDANTNQINFCPKVSNTSMGTDTDTQFLMSSDSGSKVQVQQAFFRERVAMFKSLSSLWGLGWREGEAGEADEKAECHRDDVERRCCHDKDGPGKDSKL